MITNVLSAKGEFLKSLLATDPRPDVPWGVYETHAHCIWITRDGLALEPPETIFFCGQYETVVTMHVQLTPKPLAEEDFVQIFIRAAELADTMSLEEKNLSKHKLLTPSDLEGLPYSIWLAAPEYLGYVIQANNHYGIMLNTNSVQRVIYH